MPLIEPDVCRFVVVGEYADQECLNIVDVEIIEVGGAVDSRADRCFKVAGDILNNWTDHLLPALSAQYGAFEVRWVDLDSASGTVGSRSSTSEETWPMLGLVSGASLPSNVYVKAFKNLQGRSRQQRRGIMRLGGIPEAFTLPSAPNTLTADAVTGYTDALEQFKDGINGLNDGWQTNICVVHTIDGVADGHSIVSTYQPSATVGTIRRRMPGYGQ